MSFAFIQMCQEGAKFSLSKGDKITLAIDAVAYLVIGLVAGLAFSGQIQADMGGVGAAAAFGGLFFICDAIALAQVLNEIKKWNKKEDASMKDHALCEMVDLAENFESLQREILNTDKQSPLRYQILAHSNQPCHKITKHLFLGSQDAFIQAHNASNPSFKTILTLCPLEHIEKQKFTEQGCRKTFTEKRVNWEYFGDNLGDDVSQWENFIKFCSTPSKQDIPKDCRDWFDHAFRILDNAVTNKTSTLVHCALGISRSATLIAAFLINRCNVTAEAAVNFLQSKRYCVEPRFMEHLTEYARLLKETRQKSRQDEKSSG